MTKARDLASSGLTLTATTTTADAALAKAGGTMTGNLAMGTNLVDGVDVSARDAVLTDTTTKATAALPKSGGAMTGAITTNSTFDGVDIATRDAVLSSTVSTATNALNNANNALPKEGGAMSGAITTNSTFDGVDVGARDSVLTSTTTTANAALPKAGGAVTGNVTFGDSNKAIFGAGSDLQIYHDGSNSYISDQGTNDLKILATDFQLKNAADNEFMITGVTDGAVTLYHNNAAKIATTSGGVAITGSATISTSSGDSLTLTKDTTEPSLRIEGDANKDFVFTVSGELLTLTQNDGTTDIVTFDHDSKAASFSGVVSADNYTVAAGGVYTTASGNDLNIVYPDGRSLFIKEAGTTHVTVDNSGNVGIGNTNPNLPLTLTCNSAANALALRARTNDDYSFMQFYNNAGSTLRGQISNHNGAMSFHTGNSAAQRLHISTAGYVTTASQTSFYATRTGNYTGYNASASGGSSLEVILYNGSTYNTGNGFDGGNGRFTAPVAGVYYFRAETYTGGTAFGQSWFVVNGSRAPGTDMVYGAATQIIGNSGILKLNANDWVGFHPYASNSNLTINAHVNHTWFRGHLLG